MASNPDVIIVGGGVIGCSIAFHLAKSGARVLVLERGRLGAEASNAASGAIAGRPGPDAFDRLETQSFQIFQTLAGELRELSGIDPELLKAGRLDAAFTSEEAKELQMGLKPYKEMGGMAEWLDHKAVRELEPALGESVLGGVLTHEVCGINNHRLTESFARAAMRWGAEIREGVEVAGLTSSGERVTGVQMYGGPVLADHVVLAAGAWSKALADSVGVALPVRPVRGQNINLQPAQGGLRVLIIADEGVLVPRNDGSILTGVTVEDVGFDNRVTAGGMRTILNRAFQIVPSLRDASINWTIAGLRPASADDLPVIGPVSGRQGLSIATAHYRSGISLAAVTGHLIAKHITQGDADLPPEFSPDRFQR